MTDPFACDGLYDDIPWVDEIRPGQDNYVYTRIRSRAPIGSATNVKATLWWSEPGTLAVPGSWQDVGGTIDVLGPTGSTTIHANEFPRLAEFTWPSSSVPPLGHYCLVSSIWSDDDPESPVNEVPVLGFLEWIRYQNNVAWRNVKVIAAAPTFPPLPRPVPSRSAKDYHFFRLWANTPSGEQDTIMRLGLATKPPPRHVGGDRGNAGVPRADAAVFSKRVKRATRWTLGAVERGRACPGKPASPAFD